MTILYLVRHGETFFNLEYRLGGDSKLTTKGIGHAEKMARWLQQFQLDSIYYSPLKRAVHTAKIIGRHHLNTPLIEVPQLTELSSGEMGSLTYAEFESKSPELFEARKADKFHWKFPGGESYQTLTERVKPFLDQLNSGQVVVVGHQGVNRAILGYLLNLSKKEIPYLVTPNDVIFEINLEKRKVYRIQDGQRKEGHVVN